MTQRWLSTICLNLSLGFQVLSVVIGKQAAMSMAEFSPTSVLYNHLYFLSLVCLGLQSIVWPIALRRFSLSFAYFYMSIAYAIVLLLSASLFGEPVTIFNTIGTAFIFSGVLLLVYGQPHPTSD